MSELPAKKSMAKTRSVPFPVDSSVQYKNRPGTSYTVVYVSGSQLALKRTRAENLALATVSEVEKFISPEQAELRAEVNSALEGCGRNADPCLAVNLADELWRRGVRIPEDEADF